MDSTTGSQCRSQEEYCFFLPRKKSLVWVNGSYKPFFPLPTWYTFFLSSVSFTVPSSDYTRQGEMDGPNIKARSHELWSRRKRDCLPGLNIACMFHPRCGGRVRCTPANTRTHTPPLGQRVRQGCTAIGGVQKNPRTIMAFYCWNFTIYCVL